MVCSLITVTCRGFHDIDPIPFPDALDVSWSPSSEPYKDRLEGLRSLTLTLHRKDSELIHTCADITTLALLQTDYISLGRLESSPDERLRHFFARLSTCSFDLHVPCSLPQFASTYISYLETAPDDQIEIVVRYLMRVVTPFFSTTPIVKDAKPTLDAHDPPSGENFQSMLPFITFIIHLAHFSFDAAQMFVDQGLAQLLICYDPSLAPSPLSEQIQLQVRIRCLLVLGALATDPDCRKKVSGICKDNNKAFNVLIRSSVSEVLTVQLCLGRPREPWIDLAPKICLLIPSYLPAPHPVPDGPSFGSHPWHHLVESCTSPFLSRFGEESAVSYEVKRKVAEQVLLFAASVDEDNWEPLTKILSRGPTGMLFMYNYIITSYLGCPTKTSSPSLQLTHGSQAFLKSMVGVSQRRGFAMIHPVDRFITLTTRATLSRTAVGSVGMDNMLNLMYWVQRGGFDVGHKPTEAQLQLRNKECDWMKFQITSIRDDPYED